MPWIGAGKLLLACLAHLLILIPNGAAVITPSPDFAEWNGLPDVWSTTPLVPRDAHRFTSLAAPSMQAFKLSRLSENTHERCTSGNSSGKHLCFHLPTKGNLSLSSKGVYGSQEGPILFDGGVQSLHLQCEECTVTVFSIQIPYLSVVAANIEVSGTIEGIALELNAGTARKPKGTANIHNTASILVNSTAGIQGHNIFFSGRIAAEKLIVLNSPNNGTIVVSGELDASNKKPGGTGGAILFFAQVTSLEGAAVVDVSGHSGGGSIVVGEISQSIQFPDTRAKTHIGRKVRLWADALSIGDAGSVLVWSEGSTSFEGGVSARMLGEGNGRGGKSLIIISPFSFSSTSYNFTYPHTSLDRNLPIYLSGFVEVSARGSLSYLGWSDLKSSSGKTGQLLLDPDHVIIGTATTHDDQLPDIDGTESGCV